VETGVKTFEQAFMADIVLPDNQTVYQHAHEALAQAYATGKMEGRLLRGVPSAAAEAEYSEPPR
jgi:hypothetical protein